MAVVGKLCELILYVQDMQQQVNFYRDVLELELVYPAGLPDYSGEYWVMFQTGEISLALHGGGKGEFGSDAPKFVFAVDAVATTRELLLKRGVTVSEIRSPAPGVQVVDCRDPEGNAFALEEHQS